MVSFDSQMRNIVSVDPFKCRMWALHDRIGWLITKETCKGEIDSFMKQGQLLPVIGRPLPKESGYAVELVCGARRLFVAQHLNQPILVELRENLSDREALLAMDIENRQRSDVSPYERGRSYVQSLRSGLFGSQEELARSLSISPSKVSRLIKVASLPSALVGAFKSPFDICERSALELLEALENPIRRQQLLRRARALSASSVKPPAAEVLRRLLSVSSGSRRVRSNVRDEVILDVDGTPLFRVRYQSRSVLVLIPEERLSCELCERICRVVSEILRRSTGKTGSVRCVEGAARILA